MILTNRKSGETITMTCSNEEAARILDERDPDSWIWFWVHKMAQRPVEDRALAFVADSFIYALGRGLKYPKIRLHYRDQRYKICLSKSGTILFKTGMLDPGTRDPVGREMYMGWLKDGSFQQSSRKLTSTDAEFLVYMKRVPVPFMAQCSKDMDSCCYCGSQLDDSRSKSAGYGPICARRWGLPWGFTGIQNVPTFSEVRNEVASGICDKIRRDPTDETNWLVFADWCDDKGIAKVTMPRRPARMPRI